jgi:hypothetical protein
MWCIHAVMRAERYAKNSASQQKRCVDRSKHMWTISIKRDGTAQNDHNLSGFIFFPERIDTETGKFKESNNISDR